MRPGPLVAGVAAVGCAVATQLSIPVGVSVLVALPLVLFLPGLVLLEALRSSTIRGAQRLVLVVALSIAVDVVVALVVNFVPSGLTSRSWAAALAGFVVVTGVVGSVRRPNDGLRSPTLRIRWIDLGAFALAAAILGGAIVLARTPVSAKQAQGYTILALVRGSKSTVKVSVQSGELQTKRYRLLVAGNHVVYRDTTFRLAPGAQLTKRIAIRAPNNAIRATLYLAGSKRPYRHVFLR